MSTNNLTWAYHVLIHPSRKTLMNDQESYPSLTISPGENKFVSFTKSNLDSINHEDNPCIEKDIESSMMCKIEKSNQEFVKKNKCLLPWMTSQDSNLKICPTSQKINDSHSITIGDRAEFWEEELLYNVPEETCPEFPKCKRSIYKLDIKDEPKNEVSNHASLTIQLESPNVQSIVDTIAYDLQSLIGEVGGTLGLFLGLSTYSFVELIEYLMNKLFK